MFHLVVLSVVLALASAVDFEIRNNDPNGAIWIGIQGNPGNENLNNGGFVLNSGQSVTLHAADNWAGRFWGRTYCNISTPNHCLTGDCGNRLECAGNGGVPPATLVEITLRGWNGLDYYDISLVDGFNTKASIEPSGGNGDGGQYSCRRSGCDFNINDVCPDDLRVNGPYGPIACNSDCNRYNTDQACCRGHYGTPQSCPPPASANIFKSRCPDAYSYAYDDTTSTFTCSQANLYVITFG